MRIITSLLFLIFLQATAQTGMRGLIVDAITKQPLENANVFISNTTYSASTNEKGEFLIATPENKFQLVVAFVGYTTTVVTSDAFPDREKRYVIALNEESEELFPVSILSAKERAKYIKLFKDNLVGTTRNAEKSSILNIDDILLSVDEDKRWLEVSADVPLIIRNPALNYEITVVLASFKYDLKQRICHFTGYQSFQDLEPLTDKNSKKIIRERERAYKGSLMHFVRSAYEGKLTEERFLITKFTMEPNPEYPGDEAVREMYNSKKAGLALHKTPPRDIIVFDPRVLFPKDYLVESDGKKFFRFKNYLQVKYKVDGEEENYRHEFMKVESDQTSQLQLVNNTLEIYKNGNLSNPEGMIVYGYMGWEKLADAVPFDFVLEK
ncbi:MAG TPA: carboxypeptidase-like regulatory domain-containing protein [Flavobacterium sp.]|jgi:hypothetical protein